VLTITSISKKLADGTPLEKVFEYFKWKYMI